MSIRGLRYEWVKINPEFLDDQFGNKEPTIAGMLEAFGKVRYGEKFFKVGEVKPQSPPLDVEAMFIYWSA